MTIWDQCAALWELPIEEVYTLEKKYYNYTNTDECKLWETTKRIIEKHERAIAREAEKQKQYEIDLAAYKEVYKWPQRWLENDRVTINGGCYLLDGLTFYVDRKGHISKMTEAIRAADEKLKILLGDEE